MPAVVLKGKTEVRCFAEGKPSVMQWITSGESGERWSYNPGHPSYQVQGLCPDLAVQRCGERVGCAGGPEPGG